MAGAVSTGSWVSSGCESGCGGSTCDGSAQPPDPSVIEFDQTTGVSITYIVVADKPVVLRVMRNVCSSVVVVEMVVGCGVGDEFAPLMFGSCDPRPGLSACQTVLPLTLTGRYRLRVCRGSCTPDDLLVVQHENNTVTDLTALMLLSTVTCA